MASLTLRLLGLLILYYLVSQSLSFVLNSTRYFAVPSPNEPVAVLITGCASGLGLDLVRELLTDQPQYKNVHVFAGVRKEADVAKLKSFPNQHRLHPLVMDVVNPDHINAAIKAVEDLNIPLYALVNNAGVSMAKGGLKSLSVDQYVNAVDQVFDVNVRGLSRITGESLKLLKKTALKVGSARIINISSLMGIIYTPYCGGKG